MKLPLSKNFIFYILYIIFFIVLIRTAFITDDAAITIRTVLNFIHGYGPNFNIDERVQAYTHPLWFLLLSGLTFLIKNVFYATFLLSISLSLVSVYLLSTRFSINIFAIVIAISALILSKSFIDFSTSGLENPLSHFCLIITIICAIKCLESYSKKFNSLFFLSLSFIYLNRPDLILIVTPLIFLIVIKYNKYYKEILGSILLGAIPVILWTLFSLYYYGFPFPNTAYAKLHIGISKNELIKQGLFYFQETFIRDPLGLTFIFIGIMVGIFSGSLAVCLSLGILLYLLYIIMIGGDFMSGRFFTAPIIISAVIICRCKLNKNKLIVISCFVIALGSLRLNDTLFSGKDYGRKRYHIHGVDDVRGFYYNSQGLLTGFIGNKNINYISADWNARNSIVLESNRRFEVACGNLGFQGLNAGPNIHMIDLCALTDPLLSRLPPIQGPWNPGHFYRALPNGYTESINKNINLIENHDVKNLYDSIRILTREKLNSLERIYHIIKFNFNKKNKLDSKIFRYPMNIKESISFKENNKGSSFLKEGASPELPSNGWASSEPWGTWAIGNLARLSLRIPTQDTPSKLTLKISVITSSTIPFQKIEIFENVGGGSTTDGPTARYAGGKNVLLKSIELFSNELMEVKQVEIVIPINKERKWTGVDHINLELIASSPLIIKDLLVEKSNDNRNIAIGIVSAIFD